MSLSSSTAAKLLDTTKSHTISQKACMRPPKAIARRFRRHDSRNVVWVTRVLSWRALVTAPKSEHVHDSKNWEDEKDAECSCEPKATVGNLSHHDLTNMADSLQVLTPVSMIAGIDRSTQCPDCGRSHQALLLRRPAASLRLTPAPTIQRSGVDSSTHGRWMRYRQRLYSADPVRT